MRGPNQSTNRRRTAKGAATPQAPQAEQSTDEQAPQAEQSTDEQAPQAEQSTDEQSADERLTAALVAALDAADPNTGTVPAVPTDALRAVVGAVRSRRFDASAIEIHASRWADDIEREALDAKPPMIGRLMASKAVRAIVGAALEQSSAPKLPTDPAEVFAQRIRILRMSFRMLQSEAMDAGEDDVQSQEIWDRAKSLADDNPAGSDPDATRKRARKIVAATAVGTKANQPADKRAGKPINPTILRAVDAGNGWATTDDVAELHVKLHGGDKTGGPGATWSRYRDAIASGEPLKGVYAALHAANIIPTERDGKRGFARAGQ